MSGCNCSVAKANLEEFVRNELCTIDTADIREHIEHCPSCQDDQKLAIVLTDAIARACREVAPDDVREHVLESLRVTQAGHDHDTAALPAS